MDYFDDIPKPLPFCETKRNFSEHVMNKVEEGELSLIKASYLAYSSDKEMLILKRAISNYVQDKPLTPHEFSIKIYNECIDK